MAAQALRPNSDHPVLPSAVVERGMQEEDVAITREQGAVQPSPADGGTEERREREARYAVAKGVAVPRGVRSAGILVLSLLAVVYTLYVGQELILPIILALVLKLLLAPAMRILHKQLRLPKALAAALLILVVFGATLASASRLPYPRRAGYSALRRACHS